MKNEGYYSVEEVRGEWEKRQFWSKLGVEYLTLRTRYGIDDLKYVFLGRGGNVISPFFDDISVRFMAEDGKKIDNFLVVGELKREEGFQFDQKVLVFDAEMEMFVTNGVDIRCLDRTLSRETGRWVIKEEGQSSAYVVNPWTGERSGYFHKLWMGPNGELCGSIGAKKGTIVLPWEEDVSGMGLTIFQGSDRLMEEIAKVISARVKTEYRYEIDVASHGGDRVVVYKRDSDGSRKWRAVNKIS